MTVSIPDENKPGAPMTAHYIRPEHLAQMTEIASVSSETPDKDVWTVLGLYFRPGFDRPFVAVVIGAARAGSGKKARFQSFAAGTLDRACGWFEGSDLRDRLLEAISEDDAERYRNRIPIMPPGSDIAFAHGAPIASFSTAPAKLRVVGLTTTSLREALEWLFPTAKTDGALSIETERAFGMPARTVRRALAIETGAAGKQGAWVSMFLNAMKCFDRELWQAGQATVANVER